MMSRSFIFAGLLLAITAAQAEEPRALRHNPFSRPPSERTITEMRIPGDDSGAASPVLNATMVAGRDRLANVGGRILRPGDEYRGYALLEVFEDRAVFDRNGKRLTVYVKPELVDSDDD